VDRSRKVRAEVLGWSLFPGSGDLSGLHPDEKIGQKWVCRGCSNYPPSRMGAPLVLQLPLDARTPISASVPDKDLPNLLCELSIFSLALAGRALTPGIKAAFRDSKHVTHDHDRKFVLLLFDKLIFHLESREKMLTTFFKISRSCWTLSSSRLRRRFSSSSGV
jgi:hypothetical protein